jgi:hypothetical protein
MPEAVGQKESSQRNKEISQTVARPLNTAPSAAEAVSKALLASAFPLFYRGCLKRPLAACAAKEYFE